LLLVMSARPATPATARRASAPAAVAAERAAVRRQIHSADASSSVEGAFFV